MLRRIRTHLTYANVMATLAAFIALGGTGYAVNKIGSGKIKNNSVRSKDVRNNNLRGKDVRNNTLTGRDVAESSLGAVPSADKASDANTVGGLTADQLKDRCPAGTALAPPGCIELQPRAAAVFANAVGACALDGRRLPTQAELLGAFKGSVPGFAELSSGGELTASVFEDPLKVVVLTSEAGSVDLVGSDAGNEKPYRCVVGATN